MSQTNITDEEQSPRGVAKFKGLEELMAHRIIHPGS